MLKFLNGWRLGKLVWQIRQIAICVWLVACVFSGFVFAQNRIVVASPINPDQFNESFDDYSPTSTKSILDVTLGTVTGAFAPNDFIVAVPGGTTRTANVLCVQMVTQDARFYAENPYGMADGAQPKLARILPVTQTFFHELNEYSQRQIAVRTVMSSSLDCLEDGSIFLPRLGQSAYDVLELRLNARGQDATAQLLDQNGSSLKPEVHCQDADEAALVAYDRRCQLDLPQGYEGKTVAVKITLDDGFLDRAFTANVYVPPASAIP